MRLQTHEDNAALGGQVSALLHGVVSSLRQIIPLPMTVSSPQRSEDIVEQGEWGVLIGITGDIYGRLVIQGESAVFGGIGELMFGMALEGEYLQSFIGELANMVAGNTATLVFGMGTRIDITPPTVMAGKLQMFGLGHGVAVPVELERIGGLTLLLDIHSEGAA